jgi:predicted RNase H-like HicB family nuclease
MQQQFDVVIERDEEGYYVASVPQLPGCHTQARSLDEVSERIREAIELCLEAEGVPSSAWSSSAFSASRSRHEPQSQGRRTAADRCIDTRRFPRPSCPRQSSLPSPH